MKKIYVTQQQYDHLMNGGVLELNGKQYSYDQNAEYFIKEETNYFINEGGRDNLALSRSYDEGDEFAFNFGQSLYYSADLPDGYSASFQLDPKGLNLSVDGELSISAPNFHINQGVLNCKDIYLDGLSMDEYVSDALDRAPVVKTSGNQSIGGQKTFTAKTTFAGETNFNANTNFAGTAQFNGTIKNKKMVGGTINMHPEGDLTNLAYFMNDLTGMLSMGGTCTCTRTDKDGNVLGEPLSEFNRKQWFNGVTSYGNLVSGGKWQSATPANEPAFAVTDIVTIDIDFSAWKNFAWTTTGGLGFGSASWRAKDVKVETNYSENGTLSTWREVYNVTNSSEAIHNFLAPGPTGTTGEKCNRIRITLTNFNSASEVRIAGIWMIGYNSKALASTLLSRVDGTMMSSLNPEKNAVYYLGTSTKRWHEVNATYMKATGNFQEGGIALQDKYGRLGVGNTWSAENVFTRKIGTKDYTDAEGNVIYTEDLYNNGIQAYYSNIAVKPTSITWWTGASKATDVQQVLPELSGIYATLPFGTHWHDQFAFCKKVTPTYETTTDGSTWTTATLDKRIFNQKMNQTIPVITDTICGSRWTWSMTSSDLKNGNGEWLVIGRSWSRVWPDMRILIEYKENTDTDWTILTDVTYPAAKGSVTPLFIRPYTGYMTNHDQLRITLSKKPGSIGTQSISAMKMLTNRWGGQGHGTELQYPYDWDENQNINLNGNLKIKNKTIEAIIDERIGTNSGGTETDALLPKTIDLGEIVADQEYPLPADMTLESFVEIDAVKLTTTIQEMSVSCTLKKSGEVQSAGVMFSAVGMNKLLQFMVTSEGMILLMTETPSSWWVEGIGISNSSINVNRYLGGEYGTDTLYGTNIKLNGTTHSPFHFDEVKTLDLDAAIAKKQDALTVGEGIAIQDNVISTTHSKKYMHVARITSSATISDTDNFAFYMNVYIISSSSTAYETIGEYYNELGYRQHVATGEIYMYNERQTITGFRFAYDNEFHVDSAYFTEGEKGKRYFGNSRTIPWSDTYDFTVVDVYEM